MLRRRPETKPHVVARNDGWMMYWRMPANGEARAVWVQELADILGQHEDDVWRRLQLEGQVDVASQHDQA